MWKALKISWVLSLIISFCYEQTSPFAVPSYSFRHALRVQFVHSNTFFLPHDSIHKNTLEHKRIYFSPQRGSRKTGASSRMYKCVVTFLCTFLYNKKMHGKRHARKIHSPFVAKQNLHTDEHQWMQNRACIFTEIKTQSLTIHQIIKFCLAMVIISHYNKKIKH